jgi:hypothetical protein
MLKSRTAGYPVSGRDSERKAWSRQKAERTLSEDDWQRVYAAFAKTGDLTSLAQQTGLSNEEVSHLLNDGLRRLGLRPIREVATDYSEVNKRAEQLLGQVQPERALQVKGPGDQSMLQHLPDVEKAVTDRAVREVATAQAVLVATGEATDVLLGYIRKLMDKIMDPDGGYLIPDKISLSMIETLSKAANSLANASSKAIEQSRLAAGEPTQQIAVQVAGFVAGFSADELRAYVKTRQLPPHMRIKGGSRDAPTEPEEKSSTLPVIDVDHE